MAIQTQNHSISARNQWPGRITRITVDGVMAEVILDCGGQEVVAMITRDSVKRLALHEGSEVAAMVKATDVMIGLPD